MAQLSVANYPLAALKYVTGLDASGNVRHGTASVNVKDYGAKGDGTTNDTVALKAAFDAVMATGATVVFDEGTYLVSGPITTVADSTSPGLHIQCKGLVIINVSASATAFDYLIYLATTPNANNVSITGGQLKIDLNNKCASGIWLRHYASGPSGVVSISTPVTVLNAKQNNASATTENYGIGVLGDYYKVIMQQPTVIGVQRLNAGGGGCKGIAITAFGGEVILNQPHVENILVPSGGTDGDGIATFAKPSGGVETLLTVGKVTINQPVFIDCQGRSFKSQCSDTTIIRPRVYRKNAVAIAQCVEFDFQRGGNNLVLEPDYEYRLNGGVSPLGSSHSCVTFQNLMTDSAMSSQAIGGFMRTEALVENYCLLIRDTSAAFSETVVEGLRIIPLGSFGTTAINRAMVEFSGAKLVAATGKTVVRVNDCSGPMNCYAIGYTGYVSGSLASKLDIEVTNMRNTLGPSGAAQPFGNLSGAQITQPDTFMFRANSGFRDLMSGLVFNFNKLRPGCVFTVDLSNVTATGAPSWGTTSYATIECLADYFASTDKTVRVTKGSGTGIWFTQDGGATWGTTA